MEERRKEMKTRTEKELEVSQSLHDDLHRQIRRLEFQKSRVEDRIRELEERLQAGKSSHPDNDKEELQSRHEEIEHIQSEIARITKILEDYKKFAREMLQKDIGFLTWAKTHENKWCTPQEAGEALGRVEEIKARIEAI
jgi:chromosome segregation ATPase